MPYKIIETHCLYQENKLSEVAVLWESNEDGSVRATFYDKRPKGGYGFLLPSHVLSPELLQRVAADGVYLPDDKKKKYFPGKRQWER